MATCDFPEMGAKLRTSLCGLLGIEVPIIEAPIAADPRLVAAVSNAGGLGMLPVTWLDPSEVRSTIRATKKLTKGPFGVNLILRWSPVENLAVCLEEGVKIVSFFWGDPSRYVETVHASGGQVMMTVASSLEARKVVDAGVDVVVAQGWEAGGHVWGKVASLPLIPSVVDAVTPTPVVAAGGIADGRGIAAALALGASGVWMGTRFVACEESPFHEVYKKRIVAAAETDTEYTSLFDLGWENAPHRTLRNATTIAWQKAGNPPHGKRPGEGENVATLPGGGGIPRYATTPPYAGMEGDVEDLALYAGQISGLISDIRPAGEIVRDLTEEAISVITREACRLTEG